MEVRFPPGIQAELGRKARATGHRSDQLVVKVVTDFLADVAFIRYTIDCRYDEIESGSATPVPGDEVFARLRAKSAARRGEDE